MKNLLLLVFIFGLFLSGYSQKTEDGRCIIENLMQTELVKGADDIGDFTITDSDGNTWNLYEQLDLGKTVFIDLFFTT